jgi:hypothetical protein
MKYVNEGAEKGDLARLVQPHLSIDEYRSKMGEDKDVVVLGMVVFGSEPAEDLVSFIEKSYDFVLDADISSGETSDGNYMVFVELERKPSVNQNILDMITDICNLTKQKVKDWSFSYYKNSSKHDLTIENLSREVINSPVKYEMNTERAVEESIELNKLRAISGIAVKSQKIRDVQLLDIQIAAGIR